MQDGEKGHTGTRNTDMVGHINDRMHLRISLKSDREERENHLWIKATVRLEKTKYEKRLSMLSNTQLLKYYCTYIFFLTLNIFTYGN